MAGGWDTWQEGEQNYRAFLLRCWQESELENEGEPGDSFVWRFALVQLKDHSSTECFSCLEELVIHLRGQLCQVTKNAAKPLGSSVRQSKNSLDESSE